MGRGKMAALWKRLEARARGFVLRNRGFSSASIAGNSVIVERENGQMALETVWLRDHCRAGGRYSWETHQRKTTLDIEHLNVPAHRVQVESDQLVVDWEDGEKSCYPLDWLKKNYSRGDKKLCCGADQNRSSYWQTQRLNGKTLWLLMKQL